MMSFFWSSKSYSISIPEKYNPGPYGMTLRWNLTPANRAVGSVNEKKKKRTG